MSAERSFEAWEEVQRHGLDLADRLTQRFTGLILSHHITPPSFSWPNPHKPNLLFDVDFEFPTQNFVPKDFILPIDSSGINGVSAIFDIGNRIGQTGLDLGACLNGLVGKLFRRFPLPFKHDERDARMLKFHVDLGGEKDENVFSVREDLGSLTEQFRDRRSTEDGAGYDELIDDEIADFNLKIAGLFCRSQGSINMSSTYDSRTHEIESSLAARGDLWRIEASNGSSVPGNESSSTFLLQLGLVLLLRDTTLLLPVHLSKQHLLWYGYDRKNGLHSLCPAVWSKRRRWLLTSMICFNPLACSYLDLQFPNGQLTYVSGEGFSTSAIIPFCGGYVQVQGHYPGEMKFSFSCKNNWGTCITPMIQWPDKSLTLGLTQALARQRSGLLMRPTVQLSLCPTFGGCSPGLQAELTHSVKEQLSLGCGYSFTAHPSVFASAAVGRSKWNGNVGSTGIVVRVETPMDNFELCRKKERKEIVRLASCLLYHCEYSSVFIKGHHFLCIF